VLVVTPAWIRWAVLFLHGPCLFVAGLLERRLRDEDTSWMGIRDRWVRASFTLSFTYLSIVSLQVLDIEVGPIDPSPPEAFPPAQRVLWYAMFSFGMGFANFLAAVGTLVPALRLAARPFRALPLVVSVPVTALLGAGVSASLGLVLSLDSVADALDTLARWLEEPAVLVGLVVGGALLPQLIEARRS